MIALIKKLKQLPIEVWVLAVFPAFFLTFIFLTNKIGFHYFFGSIEEGYLNYFFLFIPPHSIPALIILSLYASIRTFVWIGINLGAYFTKTPIDRIRWWTERWSTICSNLRDITLYAVPLSIASLVLISKLLYLGTFDATRITNTSLSMMQFDYSLFGVYLPFWIQGQDWSILADSIVLEAYMLLTTVLTLTILGLIAIRGRQQFRAFVLSFFMASAIATPIWMAFPAVTPNELFRENVLQIDTTTPLAMYAITQSAKIGPKTSTLLASVDSLQSRPNIGHYHVPTFPSMHVAWGIIFVYFGFIIVWPLGIIFTFWWLLNISGAVLSLQHYAVDVILGAFVGILAIMLTRFLLSFEKKYLSVPRHTYAFLNTLYLDLKRFNDFLIARAKVFTKK